MLRSGMNNLPIQLSDIQAAQKRIADSVKRTPCRHARLAGLDLYFKFENRQETHSFKERGARAKPAPVKTYDLGGKVGFLDFGMVRRIPREHFERERALGRAIADGDAARVHELMAELG